MNLEEFRAKRLILRCKRCGAEGLKEYKQPNANGIGAKCYNCGSKTPLAPDIWFSQNKSKTIQPARTFEKFGDFQDIIYISSNGVEFSVNFEPKIIQKLTKSRIEDCIAALRTAFYDVRGDLQ